MELEKNIKFKKEYYDFIKELTDKQAGELVKGLCAYVYEGKPFLTKDEYLKGAFLYLKRELDVSARNSVNGKKGAEKLAEMKRKAACGMIIGSITVTKQDGRKA
ncbi:MAG: DUF6291 domain-containing protein [Lachnospiraceae bacterium]|nr:DUF6291 domain-containing protein [Lachnospiraceae bacterium]